MSRAALCPRACLNMLGMVLTFAVSGVISSVLLISIMSAFRKRQKLHAWSGILSFVGFISLLVAHLIGRMALNISSTSAPTRHSNIILSNLLWGVELWAGAGVVCVVASLILRIRSLGKDKEASKRDVINHM